MAFWEIQPKRGESKKGFLHVGKVILRANILLKGIEMNYIFKGHSGKRECILRASHSKEDHSKTDHSKGRLCKKKHNKKGI